MSLVTPMWRWRVWWSLGLARWLPWYWRTHSAITRRRQLESPREKLSVTTFPIWYQKNMCRFIEQNHFYFFSLCIFVNLFCLPFWFFSFRISLLCRASLTSHSSSQALNHCMSLVLRLKTNKIAKREATLYIKLFSSLSLSPSIHVSIYT